MQDSSNVGSRLGGQWMASLPPCASPLRHSPSLSLPFSPSVSLSLPLALLSPALPSVLARSCARCLHPYLCHCPCPSCHLGLADEILKPAAGGEQTAAWTSLVPGQHGPVLVWIQHSACSPRFANSLVRVLFRVFWVTHWTSNRSCCEDDSFPSRWSRDNKKLCASFSAFLS